MLESEGLEVKRVGPKAPNMNAYAERWVQTMKTECLDHFVVLGEAHLRHLVSEFLAHYHEERLHQAKENQPLSGIAPPETADVIRCENVVCRERLGGLLKSYSRQADEAVFLVGQHFRTGRRLSAMSGMGSRPFRRSV